MGMAKGRTRFNIVAAFPNGDYVRITSRKDRTLTIAELIKAIREHADSLENALRSAETRKEPAK